MVEKKEDLLKEILRELEDIQNSIEDLKDSNKKRVRSRSYKCYIRGLIWIIQYMFTFVTAFIFKK